MVELGYGLLCPHHDPDRSGTPAQRAAIAEIVAGPEFDYACHNPLTEEVGRSYRGPFNFLYYTKDGRLHLSRIGGPRPAAAPFRAE